jgi:hypothetical protein
MKELKEVTRGIIGERCWRVQLGYGDELTLHFGAKVPTVPVALGLQVMLWAIQWAGLALHKPSVLRWA